MDGYRVDIMLDLNDINLILADTFFNGDTTIMGLVLYTVVLAVLFAMKRNVFQSLLLSLPMTLVFAFLGILSTDMTILLIIVTVLGLGITSSNALSRK